MLGTQDELDGVAPVVADDLKPYISWVGSVITMPVPTPDQPSITPNPPRDCLCGILPGSRVGVVAVALGSR